MRTSPNTETTYVEMKENKLLNFSRLQVDRQGFPVKEVSSPLPTLK